jgi:aminoglycoside 6-adenylyltransferase
MHKSYDGTIEHLKSWCRQEKDIQAALILGSQVRKSNAGDEWSDLDLLLFVDEPEKFVQSGEWFKFLGETLCLKIEETNLDWIHLTWRVVRILFTDNRCIDFSIIPYNRIDDALAINAEIHAHGYEVLYDAFGNLVASKIEATLGDLKELQPEYPTENEIVRLVQRLMFQLIYAGKKIKRNELWVAVSCINQSINQDLLQLIEHHAALTPQKPQQIAYEGRFLEQRISGKVRGKLPYCFAEYDSQHAAQTIGCLIDIISELSKDISDERGYHFDSALFEGIRKLHTEMFG